MLSYLTDIVLIICSGYLYQMFHPTVKVVQVCSEMIQSTEFPRPDSAALLSRQKVKLNDGQRVRQVTVHHQIRECDVPQVSTTSLHYVTPHQYGTNQLCLLITCVMYLDCCTCPASRN